MVVPWVLHDLMVTSPHESFMSGIVAFYYGEDVAVSGDAALQAWVVDIFTNGFLGRISSGTASPHPWVPWGVPRGGGGTRTGP